MMNKAKGGYKMASKKMGKNMGSASPMPETKKREAQVQMFKKMAAAKKKK